MVCPGRPDLQIDELLLWAWTEQESHACNYQAELSYVSMAVDHVCFQNSAFYTPMPSSLKINKGRISFWLEIAFSLD